MRKITLKLLKKLPQKYVTTGLIIIIILFIYGVVGSYFIMKLNFIDSVYYSVITMATVGYGDYIPKTGIQKMFATTLALSGVALLAYVFNTLLTNFQERLILFSKGVRKMKLIEKMKDYYIICGYGRVGKVVLNELIERNQNVVIIEKNEEIVEKIEETDSLIALHEDATDNDLISKLAGEKCRSVILCTGEDVINIFIVLTIRETNPDAWIVSRASKIENISRLKKAGANKVVSPEVIGGRDLYFESARPRLLNITIRHDFDEIFNESEIINKHGCNLENVQYHLPGIETPFTRKIKKKDFIDGKHYKHYLNLHDDKKEAFKNLYHTVNNIHTHEISGPDNVNFDNLVEDLGEIGEIIGINLTNKEIAEITKKEMDN